MSKYMAWGVTTGQDAGLRPGSRIPMTRPVLTPPVHAAEDGAEATLCGLPTDQFAMFQPWNTVNGKAKCDDCVVRAAGLA